MSIGWYVDNKLCISYYKEDKQLKQLKLLKIIIKYLKTKRIGQGIYLEKNVYANLLTLKK